jgi:two-component system, NarL family, response regulator LiaR
MTNHAANRQSRVSAVRPDQKKREWMNIRILIVDDHVMVREGLRTFLAHHRELHVVGEAADGTQAVEEACRLRPDVVLMDLLLPGMDGETATSAICKELPETRVIILTNVLNKASLTRAIQAGAMGYLLKDAQADELRRAIKAVARGQVYLSPQVSAFLVEHVRKAERQKPLLSRRENDVLLLLARGLDNRDIASALHMREDTAKTHVRHILHKLGVQSRTQAILMGMRLGLVPEETRS